VRGGTPGEKKTKTKNNLGTDGAEEEALAKNVEGEKARDVEEWHGTDLRYLEAKETYSEAKETYY
jgi:hypothetical protein